MRICAGSLFEVPEPAARLRRNLRRRRDQAVGHRFRNRQALWIADRDVGEFLVANAVEESLNDTLLRPAGCQLLIRYAGYRPGETDPLGADIRDFAVALVAE